MNVQRNPKVATYNTNRNSPHKLLANREIPAIIQGVIPLVHQTIAYGVLTCGTALHDLRTVLLEEILTGAAPSAARHAHDYLLMDNHTYCMQIPSNCRKPIRDRLLNHRDDTMDDRWDFSVRQ